MRTTTRLPSRCVPQAHARPIVSGGAAALLVFLLFFFSNDTGNNMRWNRQVLVVIGFAVTILVLMMVLLLRRETIRLHTKPFLIGLVITEICLFDMVLYNDFAWANVAFLAALWTGVLLVHLLTFEQFVKAYVQVMVLLCLYSLVCNWLLTPVIVWRFPQFPVLTSTAGTPFLNFFFSFCLQYLGINRNYGLFREPGVYQVFILAALAMELFMSRQKKSVFRLTVLLVTLVSTFSTIGILCGVLLLLVYAVPRMSRVQGRVLFGCLLALAVVIVVFVSSDRLQELLSRSLGKILDPTGVSFRVRFESIFNSLEASLRNPVTGLSLNNALVYIVENLNEFGTNDVTGTTVILCAGFGWPVGLFVNYLLFQFGHANLAAKDNVAACLLFVVLFLSINTQNLVYNAMVWVFLLCAYMEREQPACPAGEVPA